jgi:hypothetical protein
VTMAERIKRDLEKHARLFKDEAAKENARAQASRAAAEGVDLALEDNPTKLHEDLELAIAEEQRLKAEARAAVTAQAQIDQAQRALKFAEANYNGPTVEAALASVEVAARELSDSRMIVEDLERRLREAKETHGTKVIRHQSAVEALQTAEAHDRSMAEWHKSLGITVPETDVTDEQIRAATEDTLAAREAVDRGTIVREAKKRIAEAEGHARSAADLRTQEERLREAAEGTDNVLSDVVGSLGCPLKVKQGRLVTNIPGRVEEPFDRLGRGDQWTMTIKDIAAPALGQNGVLIIDQEGFEGMDTEHRDLVARAAAEAGLYALTAEWGDEAELSVEVYEPAA